MRKKVPELINKSPHLLSTWHKKGILYETFESPQKKIIIGWQEWCALPDLGLPAVKAKIDTGAKTSSIHAFNIHPFQRQGQSYVHFDIHPLQHDDKTSVRCTAKVVDYRDVMNSGGQKEKRYVISTTLLLGGKRWSIEITLANRDAMSFRMLLGREALSNHMIIDPCKTQHQGRLSNNKARKRYSS